MLWTTDRVLPDAGTGVPRRRSAACRLQEREHVRDRFGGEQGSQVGGDPPDGRPAGARVVAPRQEDDRRAVALRRQRPAGGRTSRSSSNLTKPWRCRPVAGAHRPRSVDPARCGRRPRYATAGSTPRQCHGGQGGRALTRLRADRLAVRDAVAEECLDAAHHLPDVRTAEHGCPATGGAVAEHDPGCSRIRRPSSMSRAATVLSGCCLICPRTRRRSAMSSSRRIETVLLTSPAHDTADICQRRLSRLPLASWRGASAHGG